MREGTTIGQYRVLRKIGEGGMGMVFAGEHVLIGRVAAIKVLKPELSERKEVLDRFFNEARATAAIRDAGIPQLYDFGIAADRSAYIVMEWLQGEPLDARMVRTGVFAPVDALRLVRQAASTLATVHAAGIVHRDLKPANLFVVADPEAPSGERVKILDFGIAKLGPDLGESSHTRTGAIMGTPMYMSPEQCGGKVVDHRSDIYSLGVVLFHLITGRPLFDVVGAGLVIAAHLQEDPPVPSELVPLPHGFDALVARCLAKSPSDRFQNMTDVLAECDRLLDNLPGQSRRSAPRVPAATTMPLYGSAPVAPAAAVVPTTLGGAVGETRPPTRRTRWLVGIAAGAIVTGVLAGVIVTRSDGVPAIVPATSIAPAANPQPPTAEPPPPPPPVAVPPDASPVDVDAGAAVVEPPPAPAKPSTKPKPRSKPHTSTDNLYDDRN